MAASEVTTVDTKNARGKTKPDYVQALEDAYGEPSRAGFGSAVFSEQLQPGADLEAAARTHYQYFVGDKWDEWGADTWLASWKEAYVRPAAAKRDIAAELRGIKDFDTQLQVGMILDNVEGAAAARRALSAAYDAPDVVALRAYNIGDGAAMSGILLAGRRESGEATFLVFLLD